MTKNTEFEDAMKKLDDIVKKLETGGINLDESLLLFEEAVKLIRLCNEKLDFAEQKVKILTESQDGSVTDTPFLSIQDET